MIKRLPDESVDMKGAECLIPEMSFPQPFASELEFNVPARGPWNIVHTGMLLPESHQIFVCARGCLRGVILTAAEMGAMGRMSWVDLTEEDICCGRMEDVMIEGVTDILGKLPRHPRAVLVFISCIQLFAGCDFLEVIRQLGKRFPDISFMDCYMHPTMRKSGRTPDQMMRTRLYSLLEATEKDENAVNILGNDFSTDRTSELFDILRGREIHDITECAEWPEYQRMASSSLNIVTLPAALEAAKDYERRLGTPYLYIPLAYGFNEIDATLCRLADVLGKTYQSESRRKVAEQALESSYDVIGDISIEIDYTATPRPLGLARLLLEHGFSVTRIYGDVFSSEERCDWEWLKEHFPNVRVTATVHPKMRFCGLGRGIVRKEKILAIGQKAAWFSGTRHFVNMVAGGGHYGFDGICRLASEIVDAFEYEKDTELVIQHKGLGLPCTAAVSGGCVIP